MSDNPYERDNPYEPDPVPPPGPASGPAPQDDAVRAGNGPQDEPREPVPAADETRPEPAPADDTRTPQPGTAGDSSGPPVAPPVADDDARSDSAGVPADTADTQRIDPAPRDGGDTAEQGPDGAVTSTFDVREARRDRLGGSHEAERPVPRSGLTEHSSARYLTGDRPTDTELERGQESPRDGSGAPATWMATGAAGGAAATGGATRADARSSADDDAATTDRPRAERDIVLDGTTALTRPPSRTGAHVWVVLLTLLLTPVAWYLLADAGARLTLPQGAPWSTGNLNVAALLELGGGLLVLGIVLLAARWSSLGAVITGSLVLIVGVPFVAVPVWTQELLEPVVAWLDDLGDFGRNVAHHLEASGSTGRLVVYGLALILVGAVSHGARRQGRREVRPVVEA